MKILEIDVRRLTVGMYVCELDRPWVDTPFLFQGFRVTDVEQVAKLQALCRRVRIDVALGIYPTGALNPVATERGSLLSATPGIAPAVRFDRAPLPRPHQAPMTDVLPAAKVQVRELHQSLKHAMDDLRAGGAMSIESVQATSAPLIDSIERNPDALAWLTAMRHKDASVYRDSIAVAVLVLTYGRHLGLPRQSLDQMALGGLLFDVGKTRVPDSILLKPDRLDDEEYAEFKRHVEYGVDILSACNGIHGNVLTMVRTHHERHDGSGYPHYLWGDSIPAFGKIVGICDAYQTMVDSATAGRRLSSHDALMYLNAQRGKTFDAALVEEFIQAIGVYPTGTLVRLSNGCSGVVYEQNRLRRLLPKVLVVQDASGARLAPFEVVDLLALQDTEAELQIVETLEPGAFDIDPDDLFLSHGMEP